MYFVHTSTCPPLSFSSCITERSTQKDMQVQAARMTHRGGSYACTCTRRVLSRGVRISPAKGRERGEVGNSRDGGAAIRSFSY